ncbi:hypothetical protein PYCCODRAFT_1465385 [Trametes coccinea BRFM310]|uniref:BTB domain-containing protein n=1 Tax=Trametes coccinea (strain BRFM310) TaxID=1353009 RepID=A0A1Y2IZ52_TRAC3|nr:hypothetical protein PYCCODRAFT_1465385 [Trametes coccinea BRFM310]
MADKSATGLESRSLSEPAPSSSTVASHPFDLDSADITLRTSDNVDFHVHQAILAIASPFFATMFQLPQPEIAASATTSRPLLAVSEKSKTLDSLLRLCYPVAKLATTDVDEIALVLQTAVKYEMTWPISFLSSELKTAAAREPLHVWAIACRLNLDDVARHAVDFLFLNAPSTPLRDLVESAGLATLNGVTAGQYARLCQSYLQRGAFPGFSYVHPQHSCFPLRGIEHITFTSDILGHDVLCRSRDAAEFPAHMAILAMHSPTLSRLFSDRPSEAAVEVISTASSELNQQPPRSHRVVAFRAGSQTLATILQICYGASHNSAFDPDLPILAEAFAVTEEYEMNQAHAVVQRLWDNQARRRPLDAYFTAARYGLVPALRAAAKLTLSLSPTLATELTCSSMESAPARSYHQLITYRLASEKAVATALANAQDARKEYLRTNGGDGSTIRHPRPLQGSTKSTDPHHIPEGDWLVAYMQKVARSVASSTLAVGRLGTLFELPALIKTAKSCHGFSSSATVVLQQLHKVAETLPQQIAAAIDEVELKL